MTPAVRVIGLGQPFAGDDGVGFAIIEHLRRGPLKPGVQLLQVREPAGLIPLLETPAPVVLVDAVLAEPKGEVLELDPDRIAAADQRPVSSHGLGVGEAISLARALRPGQVSPQIRILAVAIARPDRPREDLSPCVAAAVPIAAERVLALLDRMGTAGPCTPS